MIMLRYVKLINGEPVDYSIEQLLQDHPTAVIYSVSELPDEKLLRQYDVYPLVTTPAPPGDVVTEGKPIRDGKEWIQTWVVREFTKEEKQEIRRKKLDLLIDNEVRDYRFNKICKSCDQLVFEKLCKMCFCYMPLKTKFKDASCPLNKW
jgi:hypothetical protein